MPLCSVSAQTSGSENVYGIVVGLEQRRHLRLAAEARDALRDVEHEVPALARDEPGGERAHVADRARRRGRATASAPETHRS